MDFGEIIKRELKKSGLTQRWLADQIGTSPSGLQNLFRNPTLETMRRIDSVLPIPEAAALLRSGKFLSGYFGNEHKPTPEILDGLESLTLAYQDVLEDPDARADFAALVEAILELTPGQRRGLLQFVQGFDTPPK